MSCMPAKDPVLGDKRSCDDRTRHADDFDPRLTGAERRGYFTTPYDSKAVASNVARLRLAEKLVFVFPQWWFNVPAILKGFFDRDAGLLARSNFADARRLGQSFNMV
jgi:NAD(P)H dehydrogenase (quinone)